MARHGRARAFKRPLPAMLMFRFCSWPVMAEARACGTSAGYILLRQEQAG